ncbi:MAG TPA: MFS transporter, partial [Chloroflexota bacterium]|nr:MFS transporter [Chloroflexota bacterium]
ERIGYALGLIQMSAFAGNAVGPLLGGFVADRFGYRPSFAVTGGLFLLAGVLTLLFVKEDFQRPESLPAANSLSGLLDEIRTRGADRQLMIMLLVLFSAQFGVSAVQPTLPLFVQVLDPSMSVAFTTGVIFTVAGVVASVSAVIWGRVGDRIGFRRLLLMMAIGAGLIYIPEGLVQTAGQLIVLRGILGIFDGGLLPSVSALIGHRSMASSEGQASQGTTFGLVNLANALGFALGPLTGGLIAASMGLRAQFFITAGILLAIAAVLPFVLHDTIGPPRRATVRA